MCKVITAQLEPLTCPSCIKKIEATLNKQTGVMKARVLFHSSKVKADIDETVIDAEQLKQLVENLGYPVLGSKVS